MTLLEQLADYHRQLVEKSLEDHGWNIAHTAEDIGVHRNTLRTWIKRLKVKFPESIQASHAKFADAQSRAMTHRQDVVCIAAQATR